jgi:hypothetical protein
VIDCSCRAATRRKAADDFTMLTRIELTPRLGRDASRRQCTGLEWE